MNREEAQARARALLNVIETMYDIKIVNIGDVIETITARTCDERKILAVCTTLNTWVAINNEALSREVMIPLDVVQGLAERHKD